MLMRQATYTRIAATACAMAAAGLSGCAGNGAGLDANGQPLVPGAQGNGPLTANFASIQAQVFTPICTTCHAGADAPHGLRLDAANSYNLLVGVPSAEVPSLLRVKPGDPDSSYVIQKLEGIAAVGARMPFGGPYLSSSTIDVIRQWITDGAQPASTGSAPASFAIVTAAPAADEVLAEAPAQIMIGFNRELDVTRIDPDSARIERSAGQGIQASAQRVAARVEVPSANPRALLLWPMQPLGTGHYRVLMRVAAPLGVTDLAGESLPAGDSADAVILTFDVEAAP
jgi:methionine-rich copper-binding protein CopC